MKDKQAQEEEASPFRNQAGIESFDFEEDFVEENIRCIPMIVRFKMDAACIKLKLAEWSKFTNDERVELALKPCTVGMEKDAYNQYLTALIKKYTGKEPTFLGNDLDTSWADMESIPEMLKTKAKELGWEISISRWKNLTDLQRFALLKLCRPGHENKNFPKAMSEFNLVNR